MDLRKISRGGCGVDSVGLGKGPVVGFYECGHESLVSGIMELVN
jgi:hypothetical protein